MSKHTVFVEAPPFAKFSDAEMRRLLGAPDAWKCWTGAGSA